MKRFVAKHPNYATEHAYGALWLYDIASREHELADKAATAEFVRIALGR